jgi:hypothetical protein
MENETHLTTERKSERLRGSEGVITVGVKMGVGVSVIVELV